MYNNSDRFLANNQKIVQNMFYSIFPLVGHSLEKNLASLEMSFRNFWHFFTNWLAVAVNKSNKFFMIEWGSLAKLIFVVAGILSNLFFYLSKPSKHYDIINWNIICKFQCLEYCSTNINNMNILKTSFSKPWISLLKP